MEFSHGIEEGETLAPSYRWNQRRAGQNAGEVKDKCPYFLARRLVGRRRRTGGVCVMRKERGAKSQA